MLGQCRRHVRPAFLPPQVRTTTLAPDKQLGVENREPDIDVGSQVLVHTDNRHLPASLRLGGPHFRVWQPLKIIQPLANLWRSCRYGLCRPDIALGEMAAEVSHPKAVQNLTELMLFEFEDRNL